MPDEEVQAIYDELNRRGVFKSDAEAQAIGHELRRRGVVTDVTQGGLVKPPAPVSIRDVLAPPVAGPKYQPPATQGPTYNFNAPQPSLLSPKQQQAQQAFQKAFPNTAQLNTDQSPESSEVPARFKGKYAREGQFTRASIPAQLLRPITASPGHGDLYAPLAQSPLGLGPEFASKVVSQDAGPLGAVNRLLWGLTTPESAQTLVAGGGLVKAGTVAAKTIAGLFAADMAKNTPELWNTPGRKWDAVISGSLSLLSGYHALPAKVQTAIKSEVKTQLNNLRPKQKATPVEQPRPVSAPTPEVVQPEISNAKQIQVQEPGTSLLRQEGPQLELQGVRGQPKPKGTTGKGKVQKAQVVAQEVAAGPLGVTETLPPVPAEVPAPVQVKPENLISDENPVAETKAVPPEKEVAPSQLSGRLIAAKMDWAMSQPRVTQASDAAGAALRAMQSGEKVTTAHPTLKDLPLDARKELLSVIKKEKAKESSGLQMNIAPGVSEFAQQDVAPAVQSFLNAGKSTAIKIARTLSPRSFVPKQATDLLMGMKGERDKAQFMVDSAMEYARKKFDRMAAADQVAFMDRYKTGTPQPTPELQTIADSYKRIDDDLYKELVKYKPSLPWKENHFRILWKVIPGQSEAGFQGVFRRPLQGTKGFMKRATLPDVSTGIANGGVPVTTNPQIMFSTAYADAMKFITAQKMWEGLKNLKTNGGENFVKFVKMGDKPPEGFTRLDDTISKVYFPVKQGRVHAGEWWVEENAGRALNNFLSRDLIRENEVGRGMLWLKNNMTAMELGLSAFHATFESGEAVGSSLGLGLRKILNLGDVKGGAKDIAGAMWSPKSTASIGGKAIKYLSNKEALVKAAGWDSILKQFPDADALLDDLFTGGGRLAMHEDYKINTIRTFKDALNSNNYIGAALRAPIALNETLMKPLFETYIPRLKVGLFLREYSAALREKSTDLTSGKMTRPELARKTWDFVEDRFGEMNFDNLFWNRTFKTALQMAFRSVTWKLGNLRATGGVLPEQIGELGSALKSGRLPQVTPKAAWFIGMSALTAAMGTVIMKSMTGKNPQSLKDYIFPQIDPNDDQQRLSLPTYWKDLAHLGHDPSGYLTSSLSSEVSRTADIWKNRDYYGVQVYDPEAPAAQKAWAIMKHYFPTPFSISSALRLRDKGEGVPMQAAGFLGFTKAPGYLSKTPAEEMMMDMIRARDPQAAKTLVQAEAEAKRRGIRREFGKGNEQPLIEARESGEITRRQFSNIRKTANMTPIERSFRMLTLPEALKVWDVATPKEKSILFNALHMKAVNSRKAGGKIDDYLSAVRILESNQPTPVR